jgi:hypothetical protein
VREIFTLERRYDLAGSVLDAGGGFEEFFRKPEREFIDVRARSSPL